MQRAISLLITATLSIAALAGCGGGGSAGTATTFSKSFGGAGYDEARSAIPTRDGGTFIVGKVNGDYIGEGANLWAGKLDANGELQWQLAIGEQRPGNIDRFRGFSVVRQSLDGGFIVAGRAADTRKRPVPSPSGDDVWVAKLSANGDIEWSREIDSAGWPGHAYAPARYGRLDAADDHATDLWPLPDGGYLVVGSSSANIIAPAGDVHIGADSAIVMRLAPNGDVIWQRRLTDGQFANDLLAGVSPIVRATADGGAILAYRVDAGDGLRLRVVRFDSGGLLVWKYEDDENAEATDLLLTDDVNPASGQRDGIRDDGFVVSARVNASGDRSGASLVVYLGRDGALGWRKRFGSPDDPVDLRAVEQICVPRAPASGGGLGCDLFAAGSRGNHPYAIVLTPLGATLTARTFTDVEGRIDDIFGVAGGPWLDTVATLSTMSQQEESEGTRWVLDTTLTRLATHRLALSTFSFSPPVNTWTADGAILSYDATHLQTIARYAPAAALPSAQTRRTNAFALEGREDADEGVAAVEIVPGSYIVAGNSSFDGWVLRITDGVVIWQRRVARSGRLGAMAKSDDGVLLADNYIDGFARVLRLAGDGRVVWQSAPLAGDARTGFPPLLSEVLALPDGGSAVLGIDPVYFPWVQLYRLDANGNLLWRQHYEDIPFESIAPTADGGFVAAGVPQFARDDAADPIAHALIAVMKLNADGTVAWSRDYALNGASPKPIFGLDRLSIDPRGLARIRPTPDGGYVIGTTEVGAIAPDSVGQPFGQGNVLLLKIDAAGDLVWSRSYGAFLDERLLDLQVASDGTLLVAGASDSLGERSEAWVLRLGADGMLAAGCNAFLGALPAAAFRTTALEIEARSSGPGLPADTSLPTLAYTTFMSTTPTLAEARQCIGAANPVEPLPPPAQRYTLTVTEPGTQTGGVVSTPGGLSCGTAANTPPCSASFAAGSDVFLAVDPGSVSRFVRWEDCDEVLPPDSGGATRCRARMDRDRAVRAVFGSAQDRFALYLTIVGTGTVRSGDGGIACGVFYGASQDCDQLYDASTAGTNQPTRVSLSVFTNLADFQGWGGDCAAAGSGNALNLEMNADKHCTATFAGAPTAFELGLRKTGNGLVVSAPGGISCGATCSAAFGVGQTVRLLATEDPGSAFDGWSGCDRIVPSPTGVIPVCEVDMNASRSVGAAFKTVVGNSYLLEFVVTGDDGIVESADHGITCTSSGPDCQELYAPGTSVMLSFNLLRASGTFQGWSGDCAGFGFSPSPTLVMNGNKRCGASFTGTPPPPFTLTVRKVGAAALVTSAPGGIDCGASCSAPFARASTVRLAVTPSAGVFSGWSNCDRQPAGANPWPDCEVDMNADRFVEVRVE